MDVRVVVEDRLGLSLICNGRLTKETQSYKEKCYLKTETRIDGGNSVKISEPGGEKHQITVLFIRRDYSEIEYQCVHEITDANPPLLF